MDCPWKNDRDWHKKDCPRESELPCERGSGFIMDATAKTTCKLTGKPIGETRRDELHAACPFKYLAMPEKGVPT